MRRICSFLIMVTVLCMLACPAFSEDSVQRIGIISAMQSEVKLLLSEAEIDRVDQVGGLDFHVGTLRGKPVVIVKAGIGKVLAAAGTATLLNRYNISEVIFTGVAGGVGDETKVLDIFVGTGLVQHDLGKLSNDGFEWFDGSDDIGGWFACDKNLIALALEAAVDTVGEDHVFQGVIATGDQFVASEQYVKHLQSDFNALACEMEGASVAAVCEQYGVPYVVLRTMSDKADGLAVSTYGAMVDTASDNSCRIVLKMLELMRDEQRPAA